MGEDAVEAHHGGGDVAAQKLVGSAEVLVAVKHVEVLNDLFVGDVALGEARHLVEDGKRVAHAAVGFLRNHVQCLRLVLYPLFFRHAAEVGDDVRHGDAREVVYLAAAQDGGQYLVFLRRGEYEDGVRGRLFERLEESVEGRLRKHVHLVDDEDFVPPYLRGYLHLVYQVADVLDGVVGGGVELVNVVRPLLVEGAAALALVARLARSGGAEAVDGAGEDAGAGGFAHAARAAEEVGVCQLPLRDGVFQRGGQRALPHDGVKRGGAVLACRYDVVVHVCSPFPPPPCCGRRGAGRRVPPFSAKVAPPALMAKRMAV